MLREEKREEEESNQRVFRRTIELRSQCNHLRNPFEVEGLIQPLLSLRATRLTSRTRRHSGAEEVWHVLGRWGMCGRGQRKAKGGRGRGENDGGERMREGGG